MDWTRRDEHDKRSQEIENFWIGLNAPLKVRQQSNAPLWRSRLTTNDLSKALSTSQWREYQQREKKQLARFS